MAPETRLLLIKMLSLSSGVFLIVAGIMGCSAPILGGGLVYTIGSAYAIIFGLIMLTVELKDKSRAVAAFYTWIDTYLKFLTLQRGKGAFYLGAGILTFFMGTCGTTEGSCSWKGWGVTNVAALYLAIVGFLHTFYIIREKPAGAGLTASMAPSDGLDFSSGAPGAGGRTQWSTVVEQGTANAAL